MRRYNMKIDEKQSRSIESKPIQHSLPHIRMPLHMGQSILCLGALIMVLSAAGCGNETVKQAMERQNSGKTDQTEAVQREQDTESTQEETDTTEDLLNGDALDDSTVSTEQVLITDGYFTITAMGDEAEKKTRDTTYFTGKFAYYQVSGGLDEAVSGKINDNLQLHVAQVYAMSEQNQMQAAQDLEEFQRLEGDAAFTPYSMDYRFKLIRNDENVLSFAIRLKSYAKQSISWEDTQTIPVTGEAHEQMETYCLNYDAKTGELIQFQELSENMEAFEGEIMEQIEAMCQDEVYRKLLFSDYADTLQESILMENHWALTPGGLEFVVDPYVLGPYSSGTITFPIAYENLTGMKMAYIYDENE